MTTVNCTADRALATMVNTRAANDDEVDSPSRLGLSPHMLCSRNTFVHGQRPSLLQTWIASLVKCSHVETRFHGDRSRCQEDEADQVLKRLMVRMSRILAVKNDLVGVGRDDLGGRHVQRKFSHNRSCRSLTSSASEPMFTPMSYDRAVVGMMAGLVDIAGSAADDRRHRSSRPRAARCPRRRARPGR